MIQKKSLFKNIIYYFLVITFVFFILLVLFLLILYFKDLNDKKNQYKRPLFGYYIIVSGSMEPTIHKKDGVFLLRKDHDSYQVGDIITFLPEDKHYKGMTITHRIVEKTTLEDGTVQYTTKGDNNSIKDIGKVTSKDIYGKVIFVIPMIGYFSFIHFFVVVGVLLVIIVFINRKKIFKRKR